MKKIFIILILVVLLSGCIEERNPKYIDTEVNGQKIHTINVEYGNSFNGVDETVNDIEEFVNTHNVTRISIHRNNNRFITFVNIYYKD